MFVKHATDNITKIFHVNKIAKLQRILIAFSRLFLGIYTQGTVK